MSKFCAKCGTELKENASFCSKCGTKINSEKKEPIEGEIVNNNTNTTKQPKSKIAAGILGILLGSLGIHNFYLGYTGKALGQLLISVLSCFVLSPISAIWGLIEGIMILTGSINVDAEGNPLVD